MWEAKFLAEESQDGGEGFVGSECVGGFVVTTEDLYEHDARANVLGMQVNAEDSFVSDNAGGVTFSEGSVKGIGVGLENVEPGNGTFLEDEEGSDRLGHR